jgi:hypothetical protein
MASRGGLSSDRSQKSGRVTPGQGQAAGIRGIVDDKPLFPRIHPLLPVIVTRMPALTCLVVL